ncbi:TIGR02444 family protein [Ningiella sp. W23]|uniref:TIGR02444 family protein n=1 Tax=Ningiella sp. W23 TaxID=3023715 RepID=UPI003757AA60
MSRFLIQKEALWEYSLDAYSNQAIKEACLELQDSMMINVNLVLCMMYVCSHRYMFDFDDLEKIELAIAESDKALIRHRAKRRGLKLMDKALYEEALKDELILEKSQHQEIVNAANALFFRHMTHNSQLSDQLSGLCLMRINALNRTRQKRLALKQIPEASLMACTTIGAFLESAF